MPTASARASVLLAQGPPSPAGTGPGGGKPVQQWVAAGTAAGQPDAKTLSVGGTGDPGMWPPSRGMAARSACRGGVGGGPLGPGRYDAAGGKRRGLNMYASTCSSHLLPLTLIFFPVKGGCGTRIDPFRLLHPGFQEGKPGRRVPAEADGAVGGGGCTTLQKRGPPRVAGFPHSADP